MPTATSTSDSATGSGPLVLTGGTGRFSGFQATILVTCNGINCCLGRVVQLHPTRPRQISRSATRNHRHNRLGTGPPVPSRLAQRPLEWPQVPGGRRTRVLQRRTRTGASCTWVRREGAAALGLLRDDPLSTASSPRAQHPTRRAIERRRRCHARRQYRALHPDGFSPLTWAAARSLPA